jgi:hypothetical protein
MLSPKVLRFWAVRCLRSANATDNPDAIAELHVMAGDLERWASEAEAGDIRKPRKGQIRDVELHSAARAHPPA